MLDPIVIGANANGAPQYLFPSMANRHGLIAGATGTGKTVTLQILAEQFSKLGVPVFAADVKGDLSGMAQMGKMNKVIEKRTALIGIEDYQLRGYPVRFWDIEGKNGHAVRTTVRDMGPDLLTNLLDLTDAQQGVLHVLFNYAEKEKLALLDFEDLESTLQWLGQNRKAISAEYGGMSTQSINAIQRKLLMLKSQKADQFFGEPALKLEDFMQCDSAGRGYINLLDARKVMLEPRVYTTFLLWFLTELFEQLDEQGDADKPRLVFFFDEAHLLFDDANSALLDRFEQVVRLIRSKGVGIYFVTQSPSDIPDSVLGQLGNRVQHALRAYTPKEQKAIRAAAQAFRENPAFDTKEKITQLGLGEALVSCLDEKGVPSIVEHTIIRPPESRMGPVDEPLRQQLIATSDLQAYYSESLDRQSAEEVLLERVEKKRIQAELAEQKLAEQEAKEKEEKEQAKARAKKAKESKASLWNAVGRQVKSQLIRRIVTRVIRALIR
ncbi:MAG: helicase HerA-like domain-containing protein [Pseudomonadota bacterium]|nr:helicase HerA-like domain-containing protein [Pseudomonadota bacterium]